MTTAKVLKLLRRRIADTDSNAAYEDATLLTALEDARSLLEAKLVKGMSGYVIDDDPLSLTYGISPDPDNDHAHIMVLRAAYDLMQQRYRDLVDSGAIGVAWRSGLEEESSIQAEKAFKALLEDLRKELEILIIVQNRATSASRPM